MTRRLLLHPFLSFSLSPFFFFLERIFFLSLPRRLSFSIVCARISPSLPLVSFFFLAGRSILFLQRHSVGSIPRVSSVPDKRRKLARQRIATMRLGMQFDRDYVVRLAIFLGRNAQYATNNADNAVKLSPNNATVREMFVRDSSYRISRRMYHEIRYRCSAKCDNYRWIIYAIR